MISLVCRKCMDDFKVIGAYRHTDSTVLQEHRSRWLEGILCRPLSYVNVRSGFCLLVEYMDQQAGMSWWSQGCFSSWGSDSMMTNILVISNLYSNYIQIIYIYQIQKFSFFQFCQSWICLFLLKTRAEQALEKYRNYLFYMIPRYSNFLLPCMKFKWDVI